MYHVMNIKEYVQLFYRLLHLENATSYIGFTAFSCFYDQVKHTFSLTMVFHQTLPEPGRPSGPYNLLGGLNPLLCCHCHAVLVPQWTQIFYMKFALASD